ncbi:hypothetical protein BHE74_00003201 [Ensete ventricosum]|nr:hypothetical protein GW17_00000168 [Ensete ventricosum]RWW87939.1 hypothetical protein BHE74_00003201 [Ensete ventricosum]RZR81392.1 hypothetical protein BHM03_00007605 [Ensete ventricosum]
MGMLLFNCREGIRQDFSPLHFGHWPVSSTTPPLARRSLPPFLPLRVFWRRLLISASSTGSVGSAIVAPRPTFWFSASEALLQASVGSRPISVDRTSGNRSIVLFPDLICYLGLFLYRVFRLFWKIKITTIRTWKASLILTIV